MLSKSNQAILIFICYKGAAIIQNVRQLLENLSDGSDWYKY